MILTGKKEIEINKYFRDFVIKHKNKFSFDENSEYIITEIEGDINADFNKNWNYLMVLIMLIENIFKIKQIITDDNYVRFEFSEINIQDKGVTKLEAFYLVCFKTLNEFWKEGETPMPYENTEPFDEIDLK